MSTSLFSKYNTKLQDFFTLAETLDDAYLRNSIAHNSYTIMAAAVLSLVIECVMIIRVFVNHPAIDTPASRVYLTFYVLLVVIAAAYLVLQLQGEPTQQQVYRRQVAFVACYLLWNVLLNSYDLYRNGKGSSLAIVTAILLTSIMINLRPTHIIALQTTSFLVFYAINHGRIMDKTNATIAVVVALVSNLLFYVRAIQSVHNRQCIARMNAQLEKEQMEGAMQYLHRLQQAQTQTAIYHHDLRHTLNLVEQLARQGNVEKIQEFIAASQENLNTERPQFFCKHETANLVLGSFYQRATEKEVQFKAEMMLPQTLDIQDTEICSLLCNLLENALKAADKVEDSQNRFVKINAAIKGNKLVITVENGFDGEVTMKNKRPVPSVPMEHHGFGVQSIIDIAQRHDGLYAFETHGQIFRAKVLLHL